MELDSAGAKHYFEGNGDGTDLFGSRGVGEEKNESNRFASFPFPSLSFSLHHPDKPFHRVMRPRLTIGVKRSVMRHSISSRASALFTLRLCRRFNDTLLPLSGLFNRPIPIGASLPMGVSVFFLLSLVSFEIDSFGSIVRFLRISFQTVGFRRFNLRRSRFKKWELLCKVSSPPLNYPKSYKDMGEEGLRVLLDKSFRIWINVEGTISPVFRWKHALVTAIKTISLELIRSCVREIINFLGRTLTRSYFLFLFPSSSFLAFRTSHFFLSLRDSFRAIIAIIAIPFLDIADNGLKVK